MPENTSPTETDSSIIPYELKKRIPTLILSGITAFITGYITIQRTQDQMFRDIESLKEAKTVNAENIKTNSDEDKKLRDDVIKMLERERFTLSQIEEIKRRQDELSRRR